MTANETKSFKNFFIKIKSSQYLNENNVKDITKYIKSQISKIPGKHGGFIDIGTFLLLYKENIIMAYCIINDINISKRSKSLETIITLEPQYEIIKVTTSPLMDWLENFIKDMQEDFKIAPSPK